MRLQVSEYSILAIIDDFIKQYLHLCRASYADGRLKGPIKACASNQGTQITVEDLFYNNTQRKQMFKSESKEFHLILDVVSKYAIHNAGVGFALRKAGESMSLRTPAKSTKIENIRIVYGSDVAKSLMSIDANDDQLQFQMNGLFTNVTYSSKKTSFLLFINHRLVESKSKLTYDHIVLKLFQSDNLNETVSLQVSKMPSTKCSLHFCRKAVTLSSI